MEKPKRGRGRPKNSGIYTEETTVRLTPEQLAWVKAQAAERRIPEAEVVRRLIDASAPPPE